ncbi:GIY-YIG nuclease family protein [Leptolyngbyaceae cyanobacterium CCMR0082]|uniref:GIY-YIG nuclease family protein n=1 Tax=Adonisia turfae CCMR0082 TaxID=2304604 RepID=A0A6M0SIJ9_9CYAN|nr:GIY-YIG nuclease family protein [Adonisia turfae]NEZ67813.1 GIY-YIG nuclease family protein [Adonisia turfae CCMR0082]
MSGEIQIFQGLRSEKPSIVKPKANTGRRRAAQAKGRRRSQSYQKRNCKFSGVFAQMMEFDVFDLPSLSIRYKNKLPKVPAIYFVVSESDSVEYIGIAQDLQSRWANHHRIKNFKDLKNARVHWLYYEWPNLRSIFRWERLFIDVFDPPLNDHIEHEVDAKLLDPEWRDKNQTTYSEEELIFLYGVNALQALLVGTTAKRKPPRILKGGHSAI